MKIFLHMWICNLKLHHADPVLPNTNITYSPKPKLHYTYHSALRPHYIDHSTLHYNTPTILPDTRTTLIILHYTTPNTHHAADPPTTPIILSYPTTPMISHCATIHLLSYLHVHLHLHLHKQQHLLLSSLPAPALYLTLCPTSAQHRPSYLHCFTLAIINKNRICTYMYKH